MASYFISDIHIKDPKSGSFLFLLEFLDKKWVENPGDIYLLGDIFDVWVADHSIFINRYHDLIDRLVQIKNKGFKIIYFEGNHDLHLERFWKIKLGFDVESGPKNFNIEGYKVRLEHGDEINQNDHAYLKLRKTLRSPFMTWLGYTLPGFWWDWFAKRWSSKSRKNSAGYMISNEDQIKAMIRIHSRAYIEKDKVQIVISGHMHVFDLFEFFDGAFSINLGGWFGTAKVLELNSNQLILWENLLDRPSHWKSIYKTIRKW